jgi:hypothetical protein
MLFDQVANPLISTLPTVWIDVMQPTVLSSPSAVFSAHACFQSDLVGRSSSNVKFLVCVVGHDSNTGSEWRGRRTEGVRLWSGSTSVIVCRGKDYW